MFEPLDELYRAELEQRPQAYRDVVDEIEWQPPVLERVAGDEELNERELRHLTIECAAIIAFALERDEPLSSKLAYGGGIQDLARAGRLARRFDEQILGRTLAPLREIGVRLAGESLEPERCAIYNREDRWIKVTSTTFRCGTVSRHISLISRNTYRRVPGRWWGLRPERHELCVDVEGERIGRHDDFVFTFKDVSAAEELRDAVNLALSIERFRQDCRRR